MTRVKPDVALLKTQQYIERDKVNFIVGMLTSNVLQATFQPVTESRTFLIGVNAGTSMFAGEKRNPFFFSTSWENNQVPEAIGKYAQDMGYRRIVTLVPNYQGGRDATAGFKHHFKGEVLDEIYVKQKPARLRGGTDAHPRAEAGCGPRLHARRHGRLPGAPVRAVRTRRFHSVSVGVDARRDHPAGRSQRRPSAFTAARIGRRISTTRSMPPS